MAGSPVKIFVVTSSYPFGTEEEFPGQEAARWHLDQADFTVVPLTMPGPVNPMPAGVHLDASLAGYRTRWRKILAIAFACVHVLLLREVVDLIRHRALTRRRLVTSVLVVAQTLLIRRGLRRVLAGAGTDVVVYSYWHSPATYAAVLLKRAGRVRLVVSRGHGSDVYEAIAPAGWHALKRQTIADVDHAWTVSQDGARELVERYGADPRRVSVSRLGVVLPDRTGPVPDPEVFRVLSVSTCTPLKQVPLIARAVGRLATAHPEAQVHWTHLGDGPGLGELRHLVEELRAARPNLAASVPGFVEHDSVLDLLRDSPYDVIVNASTSEGVPVSIMEAMSYGVPAIAPDIGGVSELVGPDTGWLLSSVVTEEELAAALDRALAERGSPQRRAAARQLVERLFDSAANYREFADDLVRRLGSGSA